ncbi:unnamed protein product [Leptidea sinapis]|uniref:STX17-like N-terminal domain-containing protein n=1 Tax=Leptidea sinapis TaxID=189913 RepID=A0A5E4R0E5_9NEOP|nr:unnamed protein product [Leptidea sinapis]
MQEDGKLPLKRVELSLTKFNDVAIPHHLDLLRQHKANILKYEELGQYARVRSEQTHARRVASQLRSLLGELEALRRGVRPPDRARFDALTQGSRERTLAAIMDYLGVIERSCIALVDSSRPSTHPRPLRTDRSQCALDGLRGHRARHSAAAGGPAGDIDPGARGGLGRMERAAE